MTPNELAQKHKLLVVDQEHLALNDDLVHEVLIVGTEGAVQPGIQIKDLDGASADCLLVEYGYVDVFIQKLIAAKKQLDAVARDLIKEKLAAKKRPASECLRLATEFVKLHNLACKEYKAAFAAVGAKLWHDDNAHAYHPHNTESVAEALATATPEGIREVWRITRPITVLDSYPSVSNADRRKLNAAVDVIRKKYQALVDALWEQL